MRVKQMAILKKAQNANFSESQITALSREDVTVNFINRMYLYLYGQNDENVDKDMSAADASRCMDLIFKKQNSGCIDKKELGYLFDCLLPLGRDCLVGHPHKLRIYHAVKLAAKYMENDENTWIVHDDPAKMILEMYVKLLSEDIDDAVVAKIIKYVARSVGTLRSTATIRSAQKLVDEACIIDDLKYNKGESFICTLINMDRLKHVVITPSQLKNLYNYDEHSFCFNRKNIHEYFSVCDHGPFGGEQFEYKEYQVAAMNKKKHPLAEQIARFCKKNSMSPRGPLECDMFGEWHTGDLFQEGQLKTLTEAYKLIRQHYEIETRAWDISVNIRTSFFVNISYTEYRKIRIYGDAPEKTSWIGANEAKSYNVNLMITPDGKVFRKYYEPKSKTVPLTMVEIVAFLQRNAMLGKIMRLIIEHYGKHNRFVHDVVDDCIETNCCLLPVALNEIVQYHNKNEFFKAKYKVAKELNVNWNKKNVNLSYMILKAYNCVEPGVSQRILTQIKNVETVPEVNHRMSLNQKIDYFLGAVLREEIVNAEKKAQERALKKTTQYYRDEIKSEVGTVILDDEMSMWEQDRLDDEFNTRNLQTNIADYVRMCRTTKKKVRLDVRTRQQMNNLHDLAAHGDHDNSTYYRRNTQEVKVPKNTKFAKLRTMLPDEFEWIKSRKRLILETELQHHCVWSYAQKISDDRCAIYSFVDTTGEFGFDGNPKRYTIEFMIDGDKKYQIIQVQGKYDRVHTEKMQTHIQEILDKQQKEYESKAS